MTERYPYEGEGRAFFASEQTRLAVELPLDWEAVGETAGHATYREAAGTGSAVALTSATPAPGSPPDGYRQMADAARRLKQPDARHVETTDAEIDGLPAVADALAYTAEDGLAVHRHQAFCQIDDVIFGVAATGPAERGGWLAGLFAELCASVRVLAPVTAYGDGASVPTRSAYDERTGVSIVAPPGWRLSLLEERAWRLFGPRTSDDGFQPTLSLARYAASGNTEEWLESTIEATGAEMARDYEGFLLVGERRLMLPGELRCYSRRYRWADPESGRRYAQIQALLLRHDVLYLVNGATLQGWEGDDLPGYETLVGSIRAWP